MKLYVVVNQEGKFFRAIGYGGIGGNWVNELDKAKFYPKLGQAKSRCTYFFKAYPKFGCPSILEFTLDIATAVKIDMLELTKRSIMKIEINELKRKERDRKYYLEREQENLREVQLRIQRLSHEQQTRR